MIRYSLYHKSLRVSAVLVAAVLVFQSGVFLPGTEKLSFSAREYVANVIGITAAVEPTEINTLTAELTRRTGELDQREREIDARATAGQGGFDSSNYVLSAVLLLLLILITTNYVFDFMRARAGRRIGYAAMG